jgi:hypothetical protein
LLLTITRRPATPNSAVLILAVAPDADAGPGEPAGGRYLN